MKVDNNNDAVEDVVFQFRFKTEQRLPNLFQVYAGVPGGANAPANSPAPVPPGTPIVPGQITTFDDAGPRPAAALHRDDDQERPGDEAASDGKPLYAVPANVGPRTMDYEALFAQGTYSPRRTGSGSSPARPTTPSGSTSARRSTR